MQVMGLKPGHGQSESDSPLSTAAQFLDEFSKPRAPPLQHADGGDAAKLRTHNQPVAEDALSDDDFRPQQLADAEEIHTHDHFQSEPLPDAEQPRTHNDF